MVRLSAKPRIIKIVIIVSFIKSRLWVKVCVKSRLYLVNPYSSPVSGGLLLVSCYILGEIGSERFINLTEVAQLGSS